MLHELPDEQAYEAELAECLGVTGYHRWFFLAALADALGLRLRAFAVADRGERIGVVPLLFRRRGPVSTVNYLPVPHVGPVLRAQALRAGQLPRLLRAVEPMLMRARVMVTKWGFAPGVDVPAGPLAARGFEVARKENFVVPATTSVDDYLKALPEAKRAAIKRCDRRGMRAGPSTRDEITRWFPERVAEPYLRQGIAPDYSLPAARSLAARLAGHPGCCGGPSGTTRACSRSTGPSSIATASGAGSWWGTGCRARAHTWQRTGTRSSGR